MLGSSSGLGRLADFASATVNLGSGGALGLLALVTASNFNEVGARLCLAENLSWREVPDSPAGTVPLSSCEGECRKKDE